MERRQEIDTTTNKDRWDWKSWLWVFLCSSAIFATVPLARNIQRFVYDSVGSAFFTYAVLAVILAAFGALVYLLAYKFRVRSTSQYLWLFSCAGLYIYFTIALRKHPEEAVHFVEYGLLSYFFFRALSVKIHDWKIYITVMLFVTFVGTVDEFIQWLMPGRVWDYRDVGINALASVIFLIAVWKAIRPEIISGPVKKYSLKMLAGILTANLIFFGLCLANTPDMVKRYTSEFESLSWLRDEEPMTRSWFFRDDPGRDEID